MTGFYNVSVKQSAERELRRVPKHDLIRLARRIETLSHDPRPQGAEKLSGEDRYRIRQGDWRILYEIRDPQKEVTVVKVGHRREVYRT